MPTNKHDATIRLAIGAALLAALLAGCGGAPQPEPAPPPPPAPAAPAETPPPPATAPSEVAPGGATAPAPAAPPPTEPSAVPKPATAAATEPSLESMHAAKPSAKISVAVDLRYSFDGAALPNQPVTLHLAVLPRAAGTNLTVSIKAADGLRVDAAPLTVSKANAAGVYRQQLSITRLAANTAELRVQVTMDTAMGTDFGFFTIPLDGGTNSQKLDPVKQR